MLECTRCKQTKEDSEFYPSKHTRCIKCVSEMNAEGYLKRKNKDKTIIVETIRKADEVKKTEIEVPKTAKKVKKNTTKQSTLKQNGFYYQWV